MLKNSPSDMTVEIEKLYGFYRGVVEDNEDPEKAGRVRVRVWGIHTVNKLKSTEDGIPTDELPWAEPCLPVVEGGVSGFGQWSVPLQGSMVMMFFENGNLLQPRYFAVLPGIPTTKSYYTDNSDESPNNLFAQIDHAANPASVGTGTKNPKQFGFQDPDKKYPLTTRLNEPDVHRLARGVSDETLVTTKNENRDIGIETALGGTWDEPESPYAAQYPHNFVLATHGGITIEYDSTPGATRINIYHPSNSYIEIDNTGNMVVRNEGQKYEISMVGKNIHIKQDKNETIDANHKRKVGGNEQVEIVGNREVEIDGDKSEKIEGNKSEDIEGNKSEEIGGNLNITVDGNANVTATNINLNGPVNVDGLLTVAGDGSDGGDMTGNFTLVGNIDVTGTVDASGDITAGGVSLINHTHGGVDSGGDDTGPPN